MQDKIDKLLTNEISRKDFLAMVGAAIVSVIGVTSLIKNLSNSFGSDAKKTNSDLRYGSSVYGGVKK